MGWAQSFVQIGVGPKRSLGGRMPTYRVETPVKGKASTATIFARLKETSSLIASRRWGIQTGKPIGVKLRKGKEKLKVGRKGDDKASLV